MILSNSLQGSSNDRKPPGSNTSRSLPPSPSNSVAASPHWNVRATTPGGAGAPGFSPAVAFCFTINYIVGTGFLTVPWAFVQGGMVMSAMLLLMVGLFADAAKDYVLESMAWAGAMLDSRMHWIHQSDRSGNVGESSSDTGDNRKVAMEAGGSSTPNYKIPSLVYSPVVAYSGKVARDPPPEVASTNGSALVMPSAKSPLLFPLTNKNGANYQSVIKGTKNPSLPNTPDVSVHGDSPQLVVSETPMPASQQPGTPDHLRGRRLIVLQRKKSLTGDQNHGYRIWDRKFEVNTLCRVFLGKTGLHMFTALLALYIYCTLWAYTSVFSSAMANEFPIFSSSRLSSVATMGGAVEERRFETETTTATFDWNYLAPFLTDDYACFAIVFALVVVPLSCLELDEQIMVQVTMSCCRFLMLFFMFSTSSQCAADNKELAMAAGLLEEQPSPPMLFQVSGLHKMLPILVFSLIFHHSIPGLSHPVDDKLQVGSIFRSAIVFSTVAYIGLGLVLGSTFGTGIEQSSNLNWKYYRGGTGTWDDDSREFVGVTSQAEFVSLFVVCFPALDVLSAYPLNAITLGNNLMGAFFGRRIHDFEHIRWIRICFRLLASVPPILFAIAMRELGRITDYAGTTGFLIGFGIPALLYLKSHTQALKRHYKTTTAYTSYASSRISAWTLVLFGFLMVAYVVACLSTS